jgi:hypothetical protein
VVEGAGLTFDNRCPKLYRLSGTAQIGNIMSSQLRLLGKEH